MIACLQKTCHRVFLIKWQNFERFQKIKKIWHPYQKGFLATGLKPKPALDKTFQVEEAEELSRPISIFFCIFSDGLDLFDSACAVAYAAAYAVAYAVAYKFLELSSQWSTSILPSPVARTESLFSLVFFIINVQNNVTLYRH